MKHQLKLIPLAVAVALLTGCAPMMAKAITSDIGQKITGNPFKFRDAKDNDSAQTKAQMEILYKWGEKYCQNFKDQNPVRWEVFGGSVSEYEKRWALGKMNDHGYDTRSYITESHPTKMHAGVTCSEYGYFPRFIEMWVASNGKAYFYAPNLHVRQTTQIPVAQLAAVASGKADVKFDNGEF